ncbi:MAG: hypothetical protein HYT98_01440 [Candidatus Sungbacteria bacterium]|nr:hypothetical protein [Candidatus Sungbacteria bacterium]
MISFSVKKISIVIAAFFLIVAVFVFRDKISALFSFGPDFSPVNPQEISLPPSRSAPSAEDQKSKVVKNEAPSYTGRDPQEVRSSPEEVKLFSAEQKEKIYGELRMHGSAVKEKPDYFFGWIQVGLLKKVIGDFEGARDAWEYAGVISPKNSVSFANLGELYWRYIPNFPKSEENFKISIKNKPNDPSTYMSLSDLYSYSYAEKKDLADDILFEGIAANPDSLDLTKYLARLYETEGKFSLALVWWQKVLEKDPQNSEVVTTIESLKKKVEVKPQ